MDNNLLERRAKAEAAFDELKTQRADFVDKINVIDSELLRLQGEARIIDELIEAAKPVEANKINVGTTDKSVKPDTKE